MNIYPDLTDGINRVKKWDVCLVRGFLQTRGLLEAVLDKTFQVALDKAGVSIDYPLEQIHEFMTAKQIRLLALNLAREEGPKSIRTLLAKFTHDVVRDDLGVKGKFWIDHQPVVRFYTPQDFWQDNAKQLNVGGHLRIQGPHHDTWFGHSEEGMNLWMAIGKVQRGNGLSLFPEVTKKGYTHHNGRYRMPRDKYLGKPVNFDMDPGDLLFFHGEMVHSSELNRTDQTRYVLTTRFSLVPPVFQEGGNSPWITSEDI